MRPFVDFAQVPQAPLAHGSPSPRAGATPTHMTQKILVVEDEEALALGVRDALQHASYQVNVLHDGREALETLRREVAPNADGSAFEA